MTTLYHFTSKRQLAGILSSGELLMTPNPHLSAPGEKFPVLWLSSESGDGKGAATVAAGLNLDQAINRQLVNRTEIRFTVEVPDDEVVTWADYADFYGVLPKVIRKYAKWPRHSEWWVPFTRSIPAEEWVEISQGTGEVWNPMLAFDGATDV